MRTSYEVSVPGPAVDVWSALADIDRVLAALEAAGSGATLVRADGGVAGSLRCRFGTTQVTYRLTATGTAAPVDGQSGAFAVAGKEARGDGALEATVTVAVVPAGSAATVTVTADIEVTGRAEGVDADHWSRVLGGLLTGVLPAPAAVPEPAIPIAAEATPEPSRPERPRPAPAAPATGLPAQASGRPRALGAAVAVVVLLVLGWVWRRRR